MNMMIKIHDQRECLCHAFGSYQQVENRIGERGAKLLSEALKTNTTLTALNLDSRAGRRLNKYIH